MSRLTQLSATLDGILSFARGDYFKKHAPESEYNKNPTARVIRDAVLRNSEAPPKQTATDRQERIKGKRRAAGEAMIKADIMTNISGKHTEHRAAIDKLQETHAARQTYLRKTADLVEKADREHKEHTAVVAQKEADYATSYMGKKKFEPKTVTPIGPIHAKEVAHSKRDVKSAPTKKLPRTEIQSALDQRSLYASSMASELRQNANIARSVRRAVGTETGKLSVENGKTFVRGGGFKAANEKINKIMPGLKNMVGIEVANIRKGDEAKAGKLKERVTSIATEKVSRTVKNPDVVKSRVADITAPLFKPRAIGAESDVYDTAAIAKKLGISPGTVEGIHRSHSKLAGVLEPFVKGARDAKAERIGDLTNQVIKKGKVFDQLRSAMNARQDYPFLKRNATRLKVAGTIGGAVVAGGGALLIKKLRSKRENQMSASNKSVIQFGKLDPITRLRIGKGTQSAGIVKEAASVAKKVRAPKKPPIGSSYQKLLAKAARMNIGTGSGATKIVSDRLAAADRDVLTTLTDKLRAKQITPEAHAAMNGHIQRTRVTLARNIRGLRITKEREGKIGALRSSITDLTKHNESLQETIASQAGRAGAATAAAKREGAEALKAARAEHAEATQKLKTDIRDVRRAGEEKAKKNLIIGGVTGAGAGVVGTEGYETVKERRKKKEPVQFAELDPIKKARSKVEGKPRASILAHALTGGLEGAAGIYATDPLLELLRHGKSAVRNPFRDTARGHLGKIGTGAVVGALATAPIGWLVEKAREKRKERRPLIDMKSKGKTIQLAVQSTNRSAVARDRYGKKLYADDKVKAENNYIRTAIGGAAVSSLLRKKTGLSLRAASLAGAATGVGIQAIVRNRTATTKDQFGDRSFTGKRIDNVPGQVAGLAAAGLAGKALLDKVRKAKQAARAVGFVWVGPVINFDEKDNDVQRYLKRLARNPQARAEEHYHRAGRAKRLIQDATTPTQDRLDARGRPRTPEWQKPWFKKAVGVGLLAIAAKKSVSGIKGLRATAAAQKAANLEPRGMAGILDAGESFFKKPAEGTRSGFENLIRSNRTISRPILKVRREIRGVKRDTSDLLNNKAEEVFRRWQGKPSEAVEKVAKSAKAKEAAEDVKSRLKVIAEVRPGKKKAPPLTKLSARGHRVIRLAEVVPDWDLRDKRGKSARIFAPGSQRRQRAGKSLKIEDERKIRDAITIGSLVAGVGGTHILHNRIQARRAAAEAPIFTEVPGTPFSQTSTAAAPRTAAEIRAINAAKRRGAQMESKAAARAVKSVLKKI